MTCTQDTLWDGAWLAQGYYLGGGLQKSPSFELMLVQAEVEGSGMRTCDPLVFKAPDVGCIARDILPSICPGPSNNLCGIAPKPEN